jgi:hypothetical protein
LHRFSTKTIFLLYLNGRGVGGVGNSWDRAGTVMTEPAGLGVNRVYTRQSVEDYLRAVADKRIELELGIVRARTRLERATQLEQRIDSLEQKVGEWVVLCLALQRDPDATAGATQLSSPSARGVTGAVSEGALEHGSIDRLERLQRHLEHLRSTWSEAGSLMPSGGSDPGSDRG